MRARIAVDMKRRQLVDRFQEKRRLLAYLARKEQKLNSSDSRATSVKSKMVFEGLWRKGRKGRLAASSLVRKRCMITGHGRRARRRFGLSRQRLRALGQKGAIGGMRRAVW